MASFPLVSATGMLGSGFRAESLDKAIALGARMIGCDAGSTDPGPGPLATGTCMFSGPALESCMARRKESADHEEAWLILAGFLLRPGFGAVADNFRIDSLWRLRDHGLYFPGKRIKCQEYILWRRVAGGLTRQRQEEILAPELEKIRTHKNLPPELIRLAGSLERIPNETKTELANLFIDTASELAREEKHCAPYLAALGLILSPGTTSCRTRDCCLARSCGASLRDLP
jgi:hypothetical protein